MYEKYEALKAERNLTDADVVRETGVASSTLSDWKAGRYKPKADKLLKLAKFFDVPLEYFLEE